MKKFFTILLTIILCVSICGCQASTTLDKNLTSSLNQQEAMVMGTFYRNTMNADIASDDAQVKVVDAEADELIKTVEDFPDSLKATNKTYYLSATGSDSNNGTSSSTPKRTYADLQDSLTSGDVVLFNRGDIFREQIEVVSGVSYGAYGTGIKPRIYGSVDGMTGIWEQTTVPGVYRFTKLIGYYSNIVFNNGQYVGKYVSDLGDITKQELNVYIQSANNYLYLYCPQGHPQDVFNSIEIVDNVDGTNGSIFLPDDTDASNGYRTDNVTFQNLCVMYSGTHCIAPGASSNVKIEGCVLGFAGAKGIFNASTAAPVGNAIEFWGAANNVEVSNNYIFQCFDTGITHQGEWGNNPSYFNNVTYQNNLIEYCVWAIESWYSNGNGEATENNINILNNIVRYSGYGWGSLNRHDKHSYSDISYSTGAHSNSITISGNTFDRSRAISLGFSNPPEASKMILSNNKFLVTKNTKISHVDKVDKDNSQGYIRYIYKYGENQSNLDNLYTHSNNQFIKVK
ncbi:MAG: hypothetical protein IJP26_04490 [Clostridia bacterium]|nr:hypothetical protein [Clostridia bacterium]